MINLVKPYDGVKDFLLQLVKQNINFGVVTNGNEYQFKKALAWYHSAIQSSKKEKNKH